MKLLIVLSVACSFAVALDRDVVAFDLEDQLGNRWESQKLVGAPYILIVADREGAQHSEQWGTEIGRRVPKRTPIIGCANFDGVPFFSPLVRTDAGTKTTAASTTALRLGWCTLSATWL